MKKVLFFAFLSVCLSCDFAFAARCVPTTTSNGSQNEYLFPNQDSKNRRKNVMICGGRSDESCPSNAYVGIIHTIDESHYRGDEKITVAAVYRCDTDGGRSWEFAGYDEFKRDNPNSIITSCAGFDGYKCNYALNNDVNKVVCCLNSLICANPKMADRMIWVGCGVEQNGCIQSNKYWYNGKCNDNPQSAQSTSQSAPQQQAPQQTSSNSGQTMRNVSVVPGSACGIAQISSNPVENTKHAKNLHTPGRYLICMNPNNLYRPAAGSSSRYVYDQFNCSDNTLLYDDSENKIIKCLYSTGGWAEGNHGNLPTCAQDGQGKTQAGTISISGGEIVIYGDKITFSSGNVNSHTWKNICKVQRSAAPETKNYSGVIKDKDTGEPLQSVNISIPGTTSGCTTDAEGKFGNGDNYCRLTSDTVTISYVGYETITGKKLALTGNDIKMKQVATQLNATDVVAVDNKTICTNNNGTWDEQNNTCRCPSNKPRWEGTGANPGCLSTCTYLGRHPNQASPERLACCRAGSATKWEGNDTQGNCICIDASRHVDASKQWDGTTCAVVNNPPTPEEQCTALGDFVRWDATTSQCVCTDETKRLDGTQCIPANSGGPELTPEQECTALGEIVRWDATTSQCVCVDETKVLNNGQCVDKDAPATPVTPEKTPEEICNELGADVALWEGGVCKCKDPKKEYQNGQCVDKPEPVRTPQDACNDLGEIAVWQNNQCVCVDEVSDFVYDEATKTGKCVENEKKKKAKALKDKTDAYKNAKDKEQSLANRTLTAATTAATGLGMMELMMGKAEQKADADAEQDMAAYMATMRCTYAGGKSVKAGPEEIELPGGNDGKLMSYRSEYIALAKSLKERKTAMDMLPGIESEEILDKAEMGLYDDENKGIESGTYASLYRAKQGSEEDQKKIDADKEKSAKRVKYGATALAAGAAVGVVGNSLINGKLGEKLKAAKEAKKEKKSKSPNVKEDNRPVIKHAPNPENMKSEAPVITDSGSSDSGQDNGVANVVGVLIGTTGSGGASATTPSGGNVGGTSPTVESQRISYDEPDVDGTKWSESQYLQCFAHFFPNDRYSSNLRSYWAKSHNNQYCSGYTGGKYIYDFKKNPNPCPQQKFRSLNAGEWEIQIRNGNKSVKGIAVCNNTAGGQEDELRDNVDAHTDSGKHCWCKITQTDLNDCLVTQKFSWEYRGEFGLVDAEDVEWFNDNKTSSYVDLYPAGYYQEGQNSCLWECADACAYHLLDYGRHRQRQMHGVPQIVDFVKKYNNM
ncbi:MAG: carboxypeptidase-like regulatory domain-containing protein [Alphaproteobacteria bacterium]|nr:carboxypeptidase-like regulatory domain-containing protein [Alphaproteobacteria bacterium]